MGDKDVVSKELLKRIALDIARILLGLKVEGAEILDAEYQRVEDRRADLVARMWNGEGDRFILHLEIQNDNQASMPWRMLRYRNDISLSFPGILVRQYLIYIGKNPLAMAGHIREEGLDFRYAVIDMHRVDCQALLEQDSPEALVLAILCDFKGRPPREVIHFIVEGLQRHTQANESRFREYLGMLEILSTNRDLMSIVREEEKMLSQVKYSDLPSYQIGMEKGMEAGMEKGLEKGLEKGMLRGEAETLARQLARRFGPLADEVRERLDTADKESLDRWADRILDAASLEEVFRELQDPPAA